MNKYDKLVKNAAGRMVPTIINGEEHIHADINNCPDINVKAITLYDAMSENNITGTWAVPATVYFFVGDNVCHSIDSRAFGAIPIEHIEAEVIHTW